MPLCGVCALVLLAGCGHHSSAPANTSTLVVGVAGSAATNLPASVVTLQVAVSSASASVQQQATASVAQGTVTFQGIAAATDYHVDLQALDASQGIVCSATASGITVVQQTSTTVAIPVTCKAPLNLTRSLFVTDIAATGLTVNWSTGSASGLSFRVYRSQGAGLSTVQDAESNGTPLNGGQAGIASLADANLTPQTAYDYNVVVQDASGNKGVFSPLSVTTLPLGQVIERRDPAGALPVGFISSVTVDPHDFNTVYVTFSTFGVGHLWKSTDGGQTWAKLDGSGSTGIPDIPAQTLFIDPLNTQHLYLGTDLGVLFSADGGATWESINTQGMANVVVERLAYQASTRRLFAFTHGRGVFVLTLP